jgi:hypothetical protein
MRVKVLQFGHRHFFFWSRTLAGAYCGPKRYLALPLIHVWQNSGIERTKIDPRSSSEFLTESEQRFTTLALLR